MPAGWVSQAAQGLGAVGGAIESIGANKAASSTQKANNASVAQTQAAQGSMLTQAEQVAQQPFQAYTGTLTAPMSANQQQANTMASQTANAGAGQADINNATGLIGQVAGNGFNQQNLQNYESPYTNQVVDTALANQNKSYLQNLAGIQAQAGGSGAFGGSREAIQEADAGAANSLNTATTTANLENSAYQNAVSAWQNDNATKLQAANAYAAAGNDVTNMNSTQISDLLKTGGVAQVIAQTDLSNQYGQFLRQQGWSAQQLQPLIQAVGAAKGGGGTTQSAPVQSNTANQILGLGSTIAGLFGGNSSSAGTPTVSNSLGAAPSIVGAQASSDPTGLGNFNANVTLPQYQSLYTPAATPPPSIEST